uniref:Uncharacterized protein n=1 Tax=Anguilla anguilla TaxID=7936 RepID=A0A0E9UUL3_ANGAN
MTPERHNCLFMKLILFQSFALYSV